MGVRAVVVARCATVTMSEAKENTGTVLIEYGDTTSAPSARPSLQDAFLRFRKDRRTAFELRHGALRPKRSAEAMETLRRRFVEQCHKYLGVPYKRKYCDPDTPEYHSPLFLDCCGLVRRAMWDLQEDFGFRIGPWNQAYMWDTLSHAVVAASEAQPGDLVFYAGDYTRPGARSQKFRMVHVEVFLGGGETGEQTIAARWQRGQVSVFPSYRFTATAWTNVTISICSIGPWLAGECRSQSGTDWRLRNLEWVGNARSIFASADSSAQAAAADSTCAAGAAAAASASAASARRPGDSTGCGSTDEAEQQGQAADDDDDDDDAAAAEPQHHSAV